MADRTQPARVVAALTFIASAALLVPPACHGQTALKEILALRGVSDVVRYHLLVDAYARTPDESAAALLQLSEQRVRASVRASDGRSDPQRPWSPRAYRLAAMLQTDAALQLVRARDLSARPLAHLGHAVTHLKRGVDRWPTELAGFADTWFVAVSRALRDDGAAPLARAFLGVARDQFDGNPVVLRESGTLAELLATAYAFEARSMYRSWAAGRDVVLAPVIDGRRDRLNEAATWLAEASRIAPEDDSAELHLGRVLALTLADNEALARLEGLSSRTQHDAVSYLATLFAAAVHDRRGSLAEAEGAYRKALARRPNGHAAAVGLADVLQRSGHVDEARTVLASLARTRVDEPFWWYLFDPPGWANAQLDQLRAEARR